MHHNEIYQATWGEVIAYVDAYNERKRREYQNLSVIAKAEAYMTAVYLSGEGKNTDIYDVFPFWTQDEMDKLTVQKYKNMLLKNSE